MKAIVDPAQCISCGLCVSLCPEVFRINGEGVSEACADVTEADRDAVQNAIDSCPVDAISWKQ